MQDKDPNNLEAHAPGAKLDAGKNRLGLVLGGFANALRAVNLSSGYDPHTDTIWGYPNALWQIGLVGTFGAAKYTDNGWMHVDNAQARYTDAFLRHILKHLAGERIDSDSGLPHMAHAAWNALAVLSFVLSNWDAAIPQTSGSMSPEAQWLRVTTASTQEQRVAYTAAMARDTLRCLEDYLTQEQR